MASNRTRRTRWLSVLAAGAVAMMTVGLGQVGGTAAALTDTATANNVKLSSGNFYPTPLVTNVQCKRDGGSAGRWRMTVSWSPPAAVPAGSNLVYKITWVPVGATPGQAPFFTRYQTGTSRASFSVEGTTDGSYLFRIQTLNGPSPMVLPSDLNPPTSAYNESSGWVGQGMKREYAHLAGNYNSDCEDGNNTVAANPTREDRLDWFGTDGNPLARGSRASHFGEPTPADTQDGPDAEAVRPGTTSGPATPTTSAAETSTTAASASTTSAEAPTSSSESTSKPPGTSPTPTPTTTTPPPPATSDKPAPPVLTNPVVTRNGDLTAGKSADGKLVVLDIDDTVQFADSMAAGATLQWDSNNELWVIASGGGAKRVAQGSDGRWKSTIHEGELPEGIG